MWRGRKSQSADTDPLREMLLMPRSGEDAVLDVPLPESCPLSQDEEMRKCLSKESPKIGRFAQLGTTIAFFFFFSKVAKEKPKLPEARR